MEVYRLPNWVENSYDLELYHSGKMGMKWGRRLYQNKDGSLTPLGRIHYGVGSPRSEAERVAKRVGSTVSDTARRVGSTASDTARRVGSTASDTARRVGSASQRTLYNVDENVSPARSMNRFDVGERRASNLGEVGTGVHRRASINGRHSILYDESMDSISESPLTLRGKKLCTSSELRDTTMDSIREHEVTQIGRFYTEQFYKGTGGHGVASRNYSDRGVLANYYGRHGTSQTGAMSPYSYHKNELASNIDKNMQNWEYETMSTRRNMMNAGASKEDIEKRIKGIDDRYDKEYDEINRIYRKKRRS